jgi:hypothetical protein
MTQIKVKQISDKTTKLVEIAGTQTITGDKTLSGTTTISGSIGLGSTATATTQASNDNSTKVATTAYVTTAVAAVSGSSATTNIQTVSTTSSITLTAPITLIRCTNTSTITITLPNGSASVGYRIDIKRCSTGTVNIATPSNQIFLDSTTLIGISGGTTLPLNAVGQTWTLVGHASGWDVV